LIDGSLAQPAHPDPDDQDGLEHIAPITERAVLPVTKFRPCAGCSGRFQGRDLHPVPEDNLTFFEGQLLCGECALRHGVI
jgi:hypothetical protein